MITWRDAPTESAADVRLRGMAVARLRVKPKRWEIQLMDGTIEGPAGSIGQGKRACLQALAAALDDLQVVVRASILTTA